MCVFMCVDCQCCMNANTVLMCKGVRPPSGSSSCVYTSQFAPKGSGGNLVTECENKARSGTKVALAALGCVTKVVDGGRSQKGATCH